MARVEDFRQLQARTLELARGMFGMFPDGGKQGPPGYRRCQIETEDKNSVCVRAWMLTELGPNVDKEGEGEESRVITRTVGISSYQLGAPEGTVVQFLAESTTRRVNLDGDGKLSFVDLKNADLTGQATTTIVEVLRRGDVVLPGDSKYQLAGVEFGLKVPRNYTLLPRVDLNDPDSNQEAYGKIGAFLTNIEMRVAKATAAV